jgi:hypothetical protein
MRIKPLRNVLIATTGISLALIASVGGWALLSGSGDPIDVGVPSAGLSTKGSSSDVATEPKKFDHLWNVTLQEPRNQQPVQVVKPSVAIPSNVGFGIKLVGTMIEPSKTLALFRDEQGMFDLKGVGQPLVLTPAGAQIENIESGMATLRYEGREIRLEVMSSTAMAQPSPNYFNGMTQVDENAAGQEMMGSEPSEMPMSLAPTSTDVAVPGDEDDIFAPLPAHMNPYGMPPPTPMGPQP